ncbi:hypothetical protein C1H87_05070 [Flavivirga eckloniae]|uniref:Uncharacterized protein n=2 Tax=Flavivirga eckloniae TaxID=1803846 RepID=A0A2K9PM25_9FLAO|nr:hypothetical protein C1H87_05070 [Flavivirga eckloniae]
MKNIKENQSPKFVEITEMLSFYDFEKIKHMALDSDCSFIFRSIDSNNPCYDFGNFKIYFGADDSRNINNDPNISDFNELTIYDTNSRIQYYKIIIVRKGDIAARKNWLWNGMEDNKIYLVDTYEKGIDKLVKGLPLYLDIIKKSLAVNKKE